jgi:hypothetical protein
MDTKHWCGIGKDHFFFGRAHMMLRAISSSTLRIILISVSASVVTAGIITALSSTLLSRGNEASQTRVEPNELREFYYSFNAPGILQESMDAAESSSPYWFLDSGGKLIIQHGTGETIQGILDAQDRWYHAYAKSNPTDTEGGAHPQNLFRLVSKSVWGNSVIQADFKIVRDNLSASPNRNASNGLLLMLRYESADTLYYAGIRVDGTAVIKKKYNGIYYTMAQTQLYSGNYDRDTKPNLLPHQVWIGLRASAETQADGSVAVNLYMQTEENGWSLLARATDHGQFGNTRPITQAAPSGIRTDFMDVLFRNLSIEDTAHASSTARRTP